MKKFSVSGLKTKVKDGFVDLKTYWNHPKEGNYISNKELFLLCIGGSGSTGVSNILSYISFAASSFLVGAVYGISFRDIFVKDLVGLFFFFFSILTMTIIDNLGRPPKKTMRVIHIICAVCVALGIGCLFIPAARTEKILPAFPQILATSFLFNVFSVYYHIFLFRKLAKKFGKFRTWVLVGSIPTIVCVLLMGFLPIKDLDYSTKLWVVNLLFSFFGLFSNFYGQKGSIMNLMTPSTQERTRIRTWEMFVSGAVGGLFMVLLPIFADLVGGLNSIETYRYIIPAGVLLCIPMVLVQVFGLKERVIIEEDHKPSVSMKEGMKEVLKNKYFWITNISNWINNIQSGTILVLNVMVVYSLRQDYLLGILTAVSGCFATVGLPFVPSVLKKWGKRKTYLVMSFLQLISFGVQILGVYTNSIVLLFLGLGSINFFNIFSSMTGDLMTPDIWDYQQYVSGERLESSSGIFSILFNPLNKVLCLIVPAVYAMIGFTSEWNILYFDDTRNQVFLWTIILMVAAKILSAIPYIFYDLSEAKHAQIIEELKARAARASSHVFVPAEPVLETAAISPLAQASEVEANIIDEAAATEEERE